MEGWTMSDDIEHELGALQNRLDAMSKRLETVEEQNEWLEQELKKRDERIDDLEHELEQVQTRTDLLDRVEEGSSLKPEERAAVLIQTLYNEAVNTNGYASIDVSGAVKALGGSVNRTLMYGPNGTFKRAVELVDDEDVLRLKKENRASEKNTRLELNITDGELPETVAGVEVKGGAMD